MGERPVRDDNFAPIRRYSFPAGVCGGDIRIMVPATATKEDLEVAAYAFQAIAEKWRNISEA